jgi:hypothetical protein
MKNLTSMTAFVLNTTLDDAIKKAGVSYTLATINRYANFLSKKLSIEMFVPCKLVDGVWIILVPYKKTEHELYADENSICRVISKEEHISYREIEEAKDRVLFEGFECIRMTGYHTLVFPMSSYTKDFAVFEDDFNDKTIEDLVKYNLELTASAQKQLFGS